MKEMALKLLLDIIFLELRRTVRRRGFWMVLVGILVARFFLASALVPDLVGYWNEAGEELAFWQLGLIDMSEFMVDYFGYIVLFLIVGWLAFIVFRALRGKPG